MAFLTTLLFWFLLLDLVNPQELFVDDFGQPEPLGVRLALAALLLSVYPWFAYWTMAAVEPIYRVFVGVFRKRHWHGWKVERVYGPSVEQIEAKEIGPIWLLASHGDEADLILNVGASPRFAYKASFRRRGRNGGSDRSSCSTSVPGFDRLHCQCCKQPWSTSHWGSRGSE